MVLQDVKMCSGCVEINTNRWQHCIVPILVSVTLTRPSFGLCLFPAFGRPAPWVVDRPGRSILGDIQHTGDMTARTDISLDDSRTATGNSY